MKNKSLLILSLLLLAVACGKPKEGNDMAAKKAEDGKAGSRDTES
jgi:hypothetical protein